MINKMGETTNFNLNKPDYNNSADIEVLNSNFSIIDNGIAPFYVAILQSTNTYKIITGLNKTSLSNGFSIKVAIPSASNGAVSIVVDSITVPVKKPNGNAVTNFKANGVYSLTYYNSVFILASGGIDDVSFTSDKLLTGYSANDSNGEKVNGTMPERGTATQSLGVNSTITLPEGHYNSIKITQSLTTKGATTYTPKTTNQSISANQYLTGVQTILGDANLIASNIISGKSIFGINGNATIQSLGGAKVFIGSKSITVAKGEPNVFSVNIGFRPTTVFARVDGSNSTMCSMSTDVNSWLNKWWKNYVSSSSNSYFVDSSITELTDSGFVWTVNTSTVTKDTTHSFEIVAISTV